MSKKKKIIYYQDEQNDDFAKAEVSPKRIDGEYVYVHRSPWKRFTRLFWYRIVATPLAFLYTKLVFHHTVVNKECLKKIGKTGYFLYGNHTQQIADALIPNLLYVRQPSFVVVHADNVSLPFLGRITPSMGALPLPDDRKAYRNFLGAIEEHLGEGAKIVIYPEAHIWPYYTGIRSFSDASFGYPIQYKTPVFCFTNTYQKRKHGKRPKIVTYVDGPFYPDESLPTRQRRRELRDRVYACMCKRAQSSEVQWVSYIRIDADKPSDIKKSDE